MVDEAVRDLARGQHPDPGGGQLDRERDAVESLHDPRDVVGSSLGVAPPPGPRGTIEEEQRRLGPAHVAGRQRQRRDGHDRLLGQTQHDAAGRENAHARALTDDQLRHLGRLVRDVLAVVEDHEPADLTQPPGHAVNGGGESSQTDRRCHGGQDELGIGDGRELRDVNRPGVGVLEPAHDLRGQTRLTDTADARQRDEARRAFSGERVDERRDLLAAPDERGRVHGTRRA